MYKQTTHSGCGMYAVANACNFNNFVTEKRLKGSSMYGNLTGKLDNWMQQDGHPFYMQALFYDASTSKLPKTATDYFPEGDVFALPLIICCTLSAGGKSHMVAVNVFKDKSVMLLDSLKEEPVMLNALSEINDMYHTVFGVYAFCDINTGNYAFL